MIASENGLLIVNVLLNVRGRDVGSFVDEAGKRSRKRSRCRKAPTSNGAASMKMKSVRANGCKSSCRSC
jgi:hypothetical protein